MLHLKHFILSLVCVTLGGVGYAQASGSNILILNSYGFDYQWANSIIDSISLGVKSKIPEVEFNVEYISTERFADPQAWVDRINLSIQNYTNEKPDAIVIISDEAWMAYCSADTEIFKDTPLFLCAVKPHTIKLDKYSEKADSLSLDDFTPTLEAMKQYRATGVIREMNIPMYISLMDDLIPNIDSYTIITDQRFYGIYCRLLIEKYLAKHAPTRPVRYLDGRYVDTDSLLTELPQVSDQSGVLLTSWLTGESGFEYSKMYVYKRMEAVLNTPIFTTNDIGLNTDCFIGGYFSDSKFWGGKVSKMIVSVLNGTPIDSIAPQTTKDEQCWINWNIATRYNISDDIIPKNTNFINRPTPIIVKYANELLTAAFILLLLIVSLAYVIRININLKRAQKSALQAINETDKANKELLQTQAELEKALHKSQAADRLKSAFISNMDHEIRTPLNSIVGFSNLITSLKDKEDIDMAIKQINENSDKLLALVKGILDLSQMESSSDHKDINYEIIDPGGLITDLVNYSNIMVKPGVNIRFTPPNPPFPITTDRNLLTKALACLMDNAVKYTTEGSIEVGYQSIDTDWVQFYVKDTGMGIQKSEIKHIFERFYKCDSYTSGSGLGLAITKIVVELLDGTIWVESTPSVGSTFYIRINKEIN